MLSDSNPKGFSAKREVKNFSAKREAQGFTLVELLVAIAIVGLVFGVIISSASALQKKSRDTQRQSDLRRIQTALQQYYADANTYPGDNEFTMGTPLKSRGPGNIKIYLNEIPSDPLSTNSYRYKSMTTRENSSGCTSSNGVCHFYILCASLESPSIDLPPSSTCQNQFGSTYNFEVTPLQ